MDSEESSDPSFTRVIPADFSFHGDPSQLFDSLSSDDQRVLQPVIARQENADVDYSGKDIKILKAIVDRVRQSTDYADSHSFINVFRGYDTVLRRHNVEPSKDLFYFKLLLKLSHSPGNTWEERFESFISNSNAKRRNEQDELLQSRYNDYLLDHVGRLFELWHVKANLRKRRAGGLQRVACKFYIKSLIERKFQNWKTKLRILNTKAITVTDLHDRNAVIKCMHAWENAAIRNNENACKADKIFAGRMLTKWKSGLNKSDALEEKAQQFRQTTGKQHILRSNISIWYHETSLKQAQRYHETYILGRFFFSWADATQENVLLYSQAELFDTQRVQKAVILKWRDGVKEQANLQSMADAFQKRVSLRKLWSIWARSLRLVTSEIEVQVVRDVIAMSSTFAIWHNEIEMNKRADAFREFGLKERFFIFMRIQVRGRALRQIIDDRIQTQTFKHWVMLEQERFLVRFRERRFKSEVFQKWRHAMIKKKRANFKKQKKIRNAHGERLARNAIQVWKNKTTRLRTNRIHAEHYYSNELKKRSLKGIISGYKDIVEMNKIAINYSEAILLRKTILKWHETFKAKKEVKRAKVLEIILLKKRNDLLEKLMQRWILKTADVLELYLNADGIFGNSNQKRMQQVLMVWKDRYNHNQKLLAVANQHDTSRLRNNGIIAWKNKLEKLDQLEDQAEYVFEMNTLLRVQSIIRNWSMKASHLDILKKKSDLFALRSRNNGFRIIFADWVDKTREILDETTDSISTITPVDEEVFAGTDDLAYTPTRRRTERVSPKMERWSRLRGSPFVNARKKLFATPSRRKGNEDLGKTV
ncbi:Sfi1 spindle body protein-domain-containing protein [Lipomyces japonicus]|uniref:Sfi1 spindle body protein-domain-containing protein n=1 Tax=Lipomyces japonicus TaxID=56871 RepID=UPI0034CE1210